MDAGADYLLTVKDNQKTLANDIYLFFEKLPAVYVLDEDIQVDKDHEWLETRRCRIGTEVA